MTSGGKLVKLIVLIFLLIASTVIAVVSFINNWNILGITFSVVAIITIISMIRMYNQSMLKIAFMFDSIENDDFTFRFTLSSPKWQKDRLLNMSLNRIKDLVLQARQEVREREKYFEAILNQITTGIIIINEQGIVFQTNKCALQLLGFSKLSHIRQLSILSEGIDQQFMTISDNESRMIKFFDESSEITLSITATCVELKGKFFKIIALTDIADDVDAVRTESWHRMSRVLTHEIMNSLAPITSLSQALLDTSDSKKILQGLKIISQTSAGLTKFVENYRSVTRIPAPVQEDFDLKPLIENEINLMGISVELRILTPDTIVFADPIQISQVVMNLLKNAVEAARETQLQEPKIWIELARNNRGNLYVDICNGGAPITDEIRENIFVPFFTTKEQGNGIGLSVSRQIMRLHEGNLLLFTKPFTRFRMQF